MEKRLAVFAGYDSKKRIDDYVIYYLTELKKVADIIFVYDNVFPPQELKKVQDLTIHQICQRHGEYDFGSYKRGYFWAKDNDLLDHYDSLIFCNDSMFGPFYPLEPIFEKFEMNDRVDFWGLFCHHGYRTPLQVQSYFMVLKKQVFSHKAFDTFMESIQKEKKKIDIICKYEVGFSQILLKQGFRADALFISEKNHPNERNAIKIIETGFPFLKRALFDPKGVAVCTNIKKYKATLRKTAPHYNPRLIENYIYSYIGKEAVNKYLFLIRWIPVKRFLFQKKIDKNGKLIIKICKLEIVKKIKTPIFYPQNIFVSIVLPVYNGSQFVGETIESILNQTYKNYEFIIVDDCSTDHSYEILQSYAAKDKRIRLFKTPKNCGNPGGPSAFGIDQVSDQSKYIIMTDQDDISVVNRLELQIRFMERNPVVEISGGKMKLFGAKSRKTHPPADDDEICVRLLTSSPISNPTIIFRKRFLEENHLNYRNQTSHDFRLLAEAVLEHRAILHNLQTILLYYRCHYNQTSFNQQQAIKQTSDRVREYLLNKLGIHEQHEIDFFNQWKANKVKPTQRNLEHLKSLFEQILLSNAQSRLFANKALIDRLSYLYRKELFKSATFSNIMQSLTFRLREPE